MTLKVTQKRLEVTKKRVQTKGLTALPPEVMK